MITAVLLKWKRDKELNLIIDHLKKTYSHLINEIIVWDNTKNNICGYGRYLASLEAKNEIIYTQDDDCLVHNIDELYQTYDGTTVVNNLTKVHFDIYIRNLHIQFQVGV